MAGHSKWAQIKHKKAITDQKKGQVFSKISREITIAAQNNPDPKSNYRLKAVVDKARSL
ncbi:MAG: YebC/PmpR family DNA-binding transcriptional regulator, partial [Patescibacteria group bacterium]